MRCAVWYAMQGVCMQRAQCKVQAVQCREIVHAVHTHWEV